MREKYKRNPNMLKIIRTKFMQIIKANPFIIIGLCLAPFIDLNIPIIHLDDSSDSSVSNDGDIPSNNSPSISNDSPSISNDSPSVSNGSDIALNNNPPAPDHSDLASNRNPSISNDSVVSSSNNLPSEWNSINIPSNNSPSASNDSDIPSNNSPSVSGGFPSPLSRLPSVTTSIDSSEFWIRNITPTNSAGSVSSGNSMLSDNAINEIQPITSAHSVSSHNSGSSVNSIPSVSSGSTNWIPLNSLPWFNNPQPITSASLNNLESFDYLSRVNYGLHRDLFKNPRTLSYYELYELKSMWDRKYERMQTISNCSQKKMQFIIDRRRELGLEIIARRRRNG